MSLTCKICGKSHSPIIKKLGNGYILMFIEHSLINIVAEKEYKKQIPLLTEKEEKIMNYIATRPNVKKILEELVTQ